MKFLKTLTVFALIILCFACSKVVTKQDTTFTIPVEEIIPDTRVCWDEFRALSLKEKLEFDYWITDTIFYKTYRMNVDKNVWTTFKAENLPITERWKYIYFNYYLGYQISDSTHFSFFYSWDSNSRYSISSNGNSIDYYFTTSVLGDSLTAKLFFVNDSTIGAEAIGSSTYHSQKMQGGEPHYIKRDFTFVFKLNNQKIKACSDLTSVKK